MMLLGLVFLLPLLSGGLLAHLIWPEPGLKPALFKAFLGVGLGLGIWSILYYLFMLLFAGQHWFIFVQLLEFLALLLAVLWRERNRSRPAMPPWQLSGRQMAFAGFALVVFLISLLSTASYLLRRKQGDWDAWMMFNRTARFVYYDPSHWLDSFSRQMDPIFHPDYPLLLGMNIASGWDTLGGETPHVPMVQSALFAIACAGLLFSGLAAVKSLGQASLGLILLWGTPALVNEGAREMADLPLAYFILATFMLIYFFHHYQHAGLLVLAGLTAGLAAWTKNEGSLFAVAAGLALVPAFFKQGFWRPLAWYAAGLAFPLVIVLSFKFFLAPPSDVLSSGLSRSLQQILETSRHLEILQFFWNEFLAFGSWSIPRLAIGILPILLVYFLLFREPIRREQRSILLAGLVILILQELGNYAIYAISPYDLTWHLGHSIERIFLQVYPLILFLILCLCQTPEAIFGSGPAIRNGVSHVDDH